MFQEYILPELKKFYNLNIKRICKYIVINEMSYKINIYFEQLVLNTEGNDLR